MGEGLKEVSGTNLAGKQVLDVGAFGGKMSAIFALLGAQVTGVDIEKGYGETARKEASKWGVAERVQFLEYDGNPSGLPNETYDLVFTKSVLLYVKDLEPFLAKIALKLRPAGRVFFLENTCRGPLDHLLRRLIHRWRGTGNYYYMTPSRISSISKVFDLDVIRFRKNKFSDRTPGWWLLGGRKKSSDAAESGSRDEDEARC